MNRKGVEFSLKQVETDLWKWQFQIGNTVTTGRPTRRSEVSQPVELKRVLIKSFGSRAT
jgi:hypothetical protein